MSLPGVFCTMSTRRRHIFSNALITRSISASLGSGTLRFKLALLRRGRARDAARQRQAARQHVLLQRAVLALQPRDLVLQRRRSSGTVLQAQPASFLAQSETAPVRVSSRSMPSGTG